LVSYLIEPLSIASFIGSTMPLCLNQSLNSVTMKLKRLPRYASPMAMNMAGVIPPQYLLMPGSPWGGTPWSSLPSIMSFVANVFPVPGSPNRARLKPVFSAFWPFLLITVESHIE